MPMIHLVMLWKLNNKIKILQVVIVGDISLQIPFSDLDMLVVLRNKLINLMRDND